jgi:hypothetical protein
MAFGQLDHLSDCPKTPLFLCYGLYHSYIIDDTGDLVHNAKHEGFEEGAD